MSTIALICEGVSEKRILTYLVERYLGDEFSINAIQPKTKLEHKQEKQADGSFGGWLEVLNHCNDETIRKAFITNDYLIIQIDTDTCEQAHYDVKATKEDGTKKSDEELYSEVCARLLREVTEEIKEKYCDRIIFAICINETECWLLPLFYSDKTKCSTNNCIYKLNKKLNKEGLGIPETDKNSDGAKIAYNTIFKKLKKKKEIKEISTYNYGFRAFIEKLDEINLEE